ncbi:hypothetical protein COV18_02740 [Candidatus Woesearchaeota archaeon CG10_big_fil_rev_8_21_14_0_10_37_12]|nr:MAG: hypothetical protein COV18_02740 [Candidatus Woesearchaeota archaeon CG10_big_fil_rev_8_21_14_0_10_37_12]
MIPGYNYIVRESPEHEPRIVHTRITVTNIVLDTDRGRDMTGIEYLIKTHHDRFTMDAAHEAIKYYTTNIAEIEGYIAARNKPGTILCRGNIKKE